MPCKNILSIYKSILEPCVVMDLDTGHHVNQMSRFFACYSRYTIENIVRTLGKCQMRFYFQTKYISDQLHVLELLVRQLLHLNLAATV